MADISTPVSKINDELAKQIDGAGLGGDFSIGLHEAMKYAVLGGGKRLRPLLVWHCCAAVGGQPDACLPAAASVEFIHAFSLVHDDLPSMDDDDLRRGRPTLHIHTSEAMALLAGDALLNLAFGTIVQSKVSHERRTSLVQELAAGCSGMISGQIFDSIPDADPPIAERARLDRIHRNKTGALIRASCRIGAICGRAGDDELDSLTIYADRIGLMFQAIDDLIDVEQSAEVTGKRTGKDAEAGKLTYPGLLGIEETRAEVSRMHAEATEAIRALGNRADPLLSIAAFIAERDR
ncbi:MAG: polyprenyl synthetase family protein [Phycisphaera sp.]|nr:MAG: polyprenyl synthetase family protein [Phycisphaera sp.]